MVDPGAEPAAAVLLPQHARARAAEAVAHRAHVDELGQSEQLGDVRRELATSRVEHAAQHDRAVGQNASTSRGRHPSQPRLRGHRARESNPFPRKVAV
jgi:hypothetical protein